MVPKMCPNGRTDGRTNGRTDIMEIGSPEYKRLRRNYETFYKEADGSLFF